MTSRHQTPGSSRNSWHVATAAQVTVIRATACEGVLFSYVDNSNVWIEGKRVQAVKQGLVKDPYEAMKCKVSSSWSYDFGQLHELVSPRGTRRLLARSCGFDRRGGLTGGVAVSLPV